jgi:outer membrane protein OmpA-like peptidoglycan-associated protein
MASGGKRSCVMNLIHRSQVSRIAIVASGALLLGGAAFAQPVRVFDDAPSIEQLRSIMIPESRPGAGRTIVIQRPDAIAAPSAVQRASTQILAAPRAPVAAEPVAGEPVASAPAAKSPVVHAAMSAPVPADPPPAHKPAAEPGIVAYHINFAFDSAALPESARPMIDKFVELLKETPGLKIRVEGHTDAVGSADYNVSLSKRRALAVGEYLARQGVEPSRLILIGKGMAEPLTANRYDPANRRVQFVRIG